MIKKLKRLEETAGVIIDADLIPAFLLGDVIVMLCATGICAIIGKIVEFLVGTPNWPEMVIAWVAVYLLMLFPMFIAGWDTIIEMAKQDPDFLEKLEDAFIEVETRDL